MDGKTVYAQCKIDSTDRHGWKLSDKVLKDELVKASQQRWVQALEEKSKISINNESKELILIGHAFAIAGEAGQIFRPTPNSDWGIDGEIEFKDDAGNASGQRLYLQLKSGDSYLYQCKGDGAEIFTIKNARHADYRQNHAYPVMLVIRTSDGVIRWMDVSEYLRSESENSNEPVSKVIFSGELLRHDERAPMAGEGAGTVLAVGGKIKVDYDVYLIV